MSNPIWNPGSSEKTVATIEQRQAYVYDRLNQALTAAGITGGGSFAAFASYLGFSTAPVIGQNLSGGPSPLNVVSPDFVGQFYEQADGDGVFWKADSLLNSSWRIVFRKPFLNQEGSPLNVVTPEYDFEVYVDALNGDVWYAGDNGLSSSWTRICPPS